MKASIIIPSLNSPMIDRTLASLRAQEGLEDVLEILVIGKDEPGLVEEDERVRLVDTGQPITCGEARNWGLERARGELILFIDSDCVAMPSWLREHQRAHASGHAIAGGAVIPEGEDYWALVYNLTRHHEDIPDTPPRPRLSVPGLNFSFERRVVDAVGRYDLSYRSAEDLDWMARAIEAGFQPYFWPAAAVRHFPNRHALRKVWWEISRGGYYSRLVRLAHPRSLSTPALFRHRRLLLAATPAVAAAVTGRIVAKNPRTFLRYPHAVPGVFVTKLAWCWGATRPADPTR